MNALIAWALSDGHERCTPTKISHVLLSKRQPKWCTTDLTQLRYIVSDNEMCIDRLLISRVIHYMVQHRYLNEQWIPTTHTHRYYRYRLSPVTPLPLPDSTSMNMSHYVPSTIVQTVSRMSQPPQKRSYGCVE
jgi:hypothetical protein